MPAVPVNSQATSVVGHETRPSPNPLQKQATPPATEELGVLRPGDTKTQKRLTREAERAAIFQKVSNDELEIPNGYRKVEALILRWHESIDEFPGHTEEIERLKHIFTSSFGFGCTVKNIENTKLPQMNLEHLILSHIMGHYEHDTLLIVYYTGHGEKVQDSDGRRHLRLSARDEWDEKSGAGNYPPVAFWDTAEKPLMTYAPGDVLVILDCCFASTAAMKGKNKGLRAYQLLAASPVEGYTSEPGPNSFTTALCSSLEELRLASGGDCFSIEKLTEKINEKRTTRAALVWDRLNTGGHVRLGPLAPAPQRAEPPENLDPESASLILRVSLRTPDLEDDHIKDLARQLPKMCKDIGVPVLKIQWVRMEDHEHRIRKVLDTFQDRINRRSISGRMQKLHTPFGHRKRLEDAPSYARNARLPFQRDSWMSRATAGRRPPQLSEWVFWRSWEQQNDTRTMGDQFWFYLIKALVMICLLMAVPYSIEDRLRMVLLAVCTALVWFRGPSAVRKLEECVGPKAQECNDVNENPVEL